MSTVRESASPENTARENTADISTARETAAKPARTSHRTASSSPPRSRPLAPLAFVWGVGILALLGVANLAGRTVVQPDITFTSAVSGRELVALRTSQSGWPSPFLEIGGERLFPLGAMEEGVRWISWPALAVDLLVALAATAGGGYLIAMWVRGRRRLLQFGLLDALLAITAIALVLGFGYLPRRQHLSDLAIITSLEPDEADLPRGYFRPQTTERRIIWQPGRFEWLRQLAGEDRLPDTGRVVAANAYGFDVRRLARLDELRVVRVYGTVTDRELDKLRTLPNLECLDLANASLRQDRGGWIDTPRISNDFTIALPRLRRLFAPDNVLQGSDLAGCTGLVELDLSGTEIDLASAAAIGKLLRLRILDLHDTQASDETLAEFAGLRELSLLDFSQTEVTDAGLVHLAKLPKLHNLWLAKTSISDAGLAELAKFPALESVRLTGSRVSKAGIRRFEAVQPHCVVLP